MTIKFERDDNSPTTDRVKETEDRRSELNDLLSAELGVSTMQFINFCQANDAWLCHRPIGDQPVPLDPIEIIRLVMSFKQLGR